MIVLTKGQTAESVVVTLNEKRTLTNGYYLFYFENITTRDVVTKVFSFAEDESSYTDRYNQFTLNTQSLFGSKVTGTWAYIVYESASNTTDPTGLTEVERGLMKLNPAADFAFETYDVDTTFKTYNG